jgi:thioredoxin 1
MKQSFLDATFEEELKKATTPVLVDFYADWCGPCKLIAPIVDQLAVEMDGKIVVGSLDVDNNQETAVKYGVMSIPTLIIFKNGQEAKRVVGYQPKENLVKAINEVLGQ